MSADTEYHYILTLSWQPRPGVVAQATRADVMPLPPGTTRDQVLNELVGQVAQKLGARNADIVFFSLEPNQL